MANKFFTMSGANGDNITFSIDNIASVQDQGHRIVVYFIQPFTVIVKGFTAEVTWCEITSEGIPKFREWFAEHNK